MPMPDFMRFPHETAKLRLWLISDLQQSDPAKAENCMRTAVEDFLDIGQKVDGICYLGDATEWSNLAHLNEMADMQVAYLGRIDAPIYYVMGNHEFDYHRSGATPGKLTIPMRERILREKQWHTTTSPSDWSFSVDCGDVALFFLSDRAELPAGRWFTTHCGHRDLDPQNPVSHDHDADATETVAKMRACGKPFFTFSHSRRITSSTSIIWDPMWNCNPKKSM